jgi:branched-chain amino acid transport system substrate-binding protein
LLLLLPLALDACQPSQPGQPGAAAAAPTEAGVPTPGGRSRPRRGSATPARLGVAISQTGPGAPLGAAQANGIRLAVDEINAQHLLAETYLDVLIQDDASDKDRAMDVFQRFINNDHVVAILGPTLSGAAYAVDPIAEQAGVPVLGISNAAGGITQIGSFIFRDNLSEAQLIRPTVAAVKSALHVKRAALLGGDDASARTGFSGFKLACQENRLAIVSEQTFTLGDTDFSQQLGEIGASQPDALFLAASSAESVKIVLQARQGGFGSLPIVGSNAFNSRAVIQEAGPAAEGVIVGSAWSANAPNPSSRSQAFVAAYRSRFGQDPDQFAAQAYAGVYIIAQALANAHTATDARAVRDSLAQIRNLDTVLGPFSFTDDRQAQGPVLVQVVRNGQLQPLK